MGPQYERQVAAARWADKYCARLEEVLHSNWRDLTDRLSKGLDQLSLYELTLGPDDSFNRRVIEPAIEAWVKRHVEPVVHEAAEEFRSTVQLESSCQVGDLGVQVRTEGNWYATDFLKLLLVPTGVGVGWGAVTAGIVHATRFLVVSTMVVSWPLLIGGLALSGVLACFGVVSLADLRTQMKTRFEEKLTPQLKEGLVGKGFTQNGKHIPSLLCRLQKEVQDTAAAAREQLAKGG